MDLFGESVEGFAPYRRDSANDMDDDVKIKQELDEQADAPSFKNINWDRQKQRDDDEISRMLSDANNMSMPAGFAEFGNKDIDQADKADDAVDYSDIDDDDLPSEEEEQISSSPLAADATISQLPALTEDEGTSHDTDQFEDLFGGGIDGDDGLMPSSPPPEDVVMDEPATLTLPGKAPDAKKEVTEEDWKNMSFEERWKLNFPQHHLSIDKWISQTNKEDTSMPKGPENVDDLIAQKFPSFARGKVLTFNRLLPEWPAEYMYKEPPHKDRDPPEFVPTKLELEIDADFSKLFRIPDKSKNPVQQGANYSEGEDQWGSLGDTPALDADDGASGSDLDQLVGGFTFHEIATACDDWSAIINPPDELEAESPVAFEDEEDLDEWDREFLQPRPLRKTKRRRYEPGLPDITSYDTRGIDNFEAYTRQLGKHVRLDLNDPYLLINDELSDRPSKRPRTEEKTKRMANGQLRRDIMHHFNLSNDDAYAALKSNHKNRIRATLTSLSVEHSQPALRLTFPYYRVKSDGRPWEYHRKKFNLEKVVKHSIGVRRPAKVKRKEMKGKTPQKIYETSKDLSLNDNSTVVLFEYCEQSPIILSNFGMGSRVINYYRRKTDDDEEERIPKLDIGEGYLLHKEDRSPFSIFGTVDPGETVPTLHNEMYRAPVFKHETRSNDFLLGYTTDAANGPRWFLRNIDHVFAVGQTFPSMDIPGPHARKVTNTSKSRMRMIAYRIMKKKPTPMFEISEIAPHVFETDKKIDAQNRQKLKEFLRYDRDGRVWQLKENETLMDEQGIRAMIRPEDVCLIESMQVGLQLIENAGYDSKDREENEDAIDEPLVAQLAPWRITKNFLEASAGKAMVALHGEGDPTGHGLGFSFIKTSMKGGYINAVQGPLATSADAIERERKANGGHSYNVKKQQDMYNTAIRQIWERQKATLSDGTTHDDADVLDTANEDDRFNQIRMDATPMPIDDGRSQFSRFSGTSRGGRRKLKITRKKQNENGEIEVEHVVVEDPVIIRNYLKQRKEISESDRDVYSLIPTADAEENREKQRLVDKELSRLLKNQDRRQIREKQGKGKRKRVDVEGSPDPSAADKAEKAAAGTTRKCANCGQVGHIKTNKSKCPLLNGTITTNGNAADLGGFGSFGAPSAAPSSVD